MPAITRLDCGRLTLSFSSEMPMENFGRRKTTGTSKEIAPRKSARKIGFFGATGIGFPPQKIFQAHLIVRYVQKRVT